MDVKLVMFKANGQRKDFPIINPVTVMGRGENCDLRVPLLNVSRRHCELSVSAKTVKVKDLASSNGTFVNNNRVNETIVKAGDRIAIGPVVFTVQIDGVPDEIKPILTKAANKRQADAEADVVAQPGASTLAGSDDEDVDPIAALEALASEEDEK